MSSTVIDPVGQLIKARIATYSATFQGGTQPLTGFWPDPGPAGLDSVPCGVVGLPTIERPVELANSESQLGTFDWYLDYPVTFFFDLAEAVSAQSAVIEVVEAFISDMDGTTLSTSDPLILDAKVVSSNPVVLEHQARPLLSYECHLRVYRQVP